MKCKQKDGLIYILQGGISIHFAYIGQRFFPFFPLVHRLQILFVFFLLSVFSYESQLIAFARMGIRSTCVCNPLIMKIVYSRPNFPMIHVGNFLRVKQIFSLFEISDFICD